MKPVKGKTYYRGLVVDRTGDLPELKTNFYETYKEAYEYAESLARRFYSKEPFRYEIDVVDGEFSESGFVFGPKI